MDFAFSEQQDELRHGVRTVLDAECSPDALRAFELADEAARAELTSNRWAVLAELGAPALVVPEAAGGLGLDDVDLVGVLEEAGRACLPEPLLETAALAAPTLAALLPDAAAAAALTALVEDDAIVAVGGIDVTVGDEIPHGPRCASANAGLRYAFVEAEVFVTGLIPTPRPAVDWISQLLNLVLFEMLFEMFVFLIEIVRVIGSQKLRAPAKALLMPAYSWRIAAPGMGRGRTAVSALRDYRRLVPAAWERAVVP